MRQLVAVALALATSTVLPLCSIAWAGESANDTYRLYCVQCHGTLGKGHGIAWTSGALSVQPRDHTSSQDMAKLSDQDLRLAIEKGGSALSKSDLMPPWGDTLSKQAIAELVLYLRELCQCQGTNLGTDSATY